jgi:hypothetical protein
MPRTIDEILKDGAPTGEREALTSAILGFLVSTQPEKTILIPHAAFDEFLANVTATHIDADTETGDLIVRVETTEDTDEEN